MSRSSSCGAIGAKVQVIPQCDESPSDECGRDEAHLKVTHGETLEAHPM
jgi:hypothetical protein